MTRAPGEGSASPQGAPVVDGEPAAYSLNGVKLVRLRDTLLALDAEASQANGDQAARIRVNVETQRLLVEVGTALPQPLLEELKQFIGGIGGASSDSEWRLVRGQLIGWLEGIFWALNPVPVLAGDGGDGGEPPSIDPPD